MFFITQPRVIFFSSHGYEFVTYTIEPVKFLPFLLKRFEKLGGRIEVGRKVRDLSEVTADVVIVCAGAWAGELVGDRAVAPLRGQVINMKGCVNDLCEQYNYSRLRE